MLLVLLGLFSAGGLTVVGSVSGVEAHSSCFVGTNCILGSSHFTTTSLTPTKQLLRDNLRQIPSYNRRHFNFAITCNSNSPDSTTAYSTYSDQVAREGSHSTPTPAIAKIQTASYVDKNAPRLQQSRRSAFELLAKAFLLLLPGLPPAPAAASAPAIPFDSILIIGCGFIGKHVAARLKALGVARVTATTTSPGKVAGLRQLVDDVVVIPPAAGEGDDDAALRAAIAAHEAVFVAVGPGEAGEAVAYDALYAGTAARVARALRDKRTPTNLALISSCGVYGRCCAPPPAREPRRRARPIITSSSQRGPATSSGGCFRKRSDANMYS